VSNVPETTEPNDPRCFQRLTDALKALHAARGNTMYFISRDDVDDKEASSFTNNYPSSPTELLGLADGAVDDRYLEMYPVRQDPHVTVAEAGTTAWIDVEDEFGRTLHVSTWLLNPGRRQRHGRIGEVAVSERTDDPEVSSGYYDADIFWIEADGRAWRRPFFDLEPRRPMNDIQVERLALLLSLPPQ